VGKKGRGGDGEKEGGGREEVRVGRGLGCGEGWEVTEGEE